MKRPTQEPHHNPPPGLLLWLIGVGAVMVVLAFLYRPL
jgi:hypothetical protein